MEKIAVIGFKNTDAVKERYAGKAQFCFDILCESNAQKYSFSAVFLKSGTDDAVIKNWLGNEHLRLAADEKVLFEEIDFFLGLPEPLEIERKFLVKKPDESELTKYPLCDFVDITQAYVNKNGKRFRVRERGKGGDFIYIKTEKIKITEMKRIEKESRITKEQYLKYIKGEKALCKRRWLILYNEKCFELDLFPFWEDRALLEIELKNETENFELPPFLSVIKEVTQDRTYRNSVLAKIYGITQK